MKSHIPIDVMNTGDPGEPSIEVFVNGHPLIPIPPGLAIHTALPLDGEITIRRAKA